MKIPMRKKKKKKKMMIPKLKKKVLQDGYQEKKSFEIAEFSEFLWLEWYALQ